MTDEPESEIEKLTPREFLKAYPEAKDLHEGAVGHFRDGLIQGEKDAKRMRGNGPAQRGKGKA